MEFEEVLPIVFKEVVLQVVDSGELFRQNLDVKSSYDEYECFLSKDLMSGFAVHRMTCEIINVFSLVKGRGQELLAVATTQFNYMTLNCFDGFLPNVYAKAGFIETKREKNWDPRGPDVVLMEFQT